MIHTNKNILNANYANIKILIIIYCLNKICNLYNFTL